MGRPGDDLKLAAELQATFSTASFPTVQRYVRESALVFPDAEPALRFYATNRIDMIEERTADGSHHARLLPLVRSKIETIIEQEGCFRVPETFGYFMADV
jgi:hypothetical protein